MVGNKASNVSARRTVATVVGPQNVQILQPLGVVLGH